MIRCIAMDIYGTVLATEDPEDDCPPRKGFFDFMERCNSLDVKVISASDGDLDNLRLDLGEVGVDIKIFDDVIRLIENPKDFSRILVKYGILPSELLVIGDNPIKDMGGAKKIGCAYFQVPQYESYNVGCEFDMGNIELRFQQVDRQ